MWHDVGALRVVSRSAGFTCTVKACVRVPRDPGTSRGSSPGASMAAHCSPKRNYQLTRPWHVQTHRDVGPFGI